MQDRATARRTPLFSITHSARPHNASRTAWYRRTKTGILRAFAQTNTVYYSTQAPICQVAKKRSKIFSLLHKPNPPTFRVFAKKVGALCTTRSKKRPHCTFRTTGHAHVTQESAARLRCKAEQQHALRLGGSKPPPYDRRYKGRQNIGGRSALPKDHERHTRKPNRVRRHDRFL